MRRGGVLQRVLPELLEGYRKKQNRLDHYDIYRHILHTIHHSPARPLVRLAALFHDIAKPRVRRRVKGIFQFCDHARASALVAEEVMHRWCVPHKEIEKTKLLVENQISLGSEKWSDATVRRLIARVGEDLLEDLLDLARADHMSRAQGESYLDELHILRSQIEKQLNLKPPLEIKDLAINGHDVMQILGIGPGPSVGAILQAIHEKILERPEWNERPFLEALLKKEYQQIMVKK
jgi:hypothetical protein